MKDKELIKIIENIAESKKMLKLSHNHALEIINLILDRVKEKVESGKLRGGDLVNIFSSVVGGYTLNIVQSVMGSALENILKDDVNFKKELQDVVGQIFTSLAMASNTTQSSQSPHQHPSTQQ